MLPKSTVFSFISKFSRIDCFSENQTKVYGEKLKEQVEDRLKFYETGDLPRKNVDVMAEAMDIVAEETKKKKKKEKKKRKLEEMQEPATNGAEAMEIVPEEENKKEKKKKDKKKKVESEVDGAGGIYIKVN